MTMKHALPKSDRLRRTGNLTLAGSAGLTAALLLFWCPLRGNPAQLLKVVTDLAGNGLPLLLPGVVAAMLYLIWRRSGSDRLQLICSFAAWTAIVYGGIYLASDRVSRRADDYYRARIAATAQTLGPQETARRLKAFRNETDIVSLSQRLAPEDEPNITIGFAGLKLILAAEAVGLALLIVLLLLPPTIGRPGSQFVLAGALLFLAATVIIRIENNRRSGADFKRLTAEIERAGNTADQPPEEPGAYP